MSALQDQFRALSLDNKKIVRANQELGSVLQMREQAMAEMASRIQALEKTLRKRDLRDQKDSGKVRKKIKERDQQMNRLK